MANQQASVGNDMLGGWQDRKVLPTKLGHTRSSPKGTRGPLSAVVIKKGGRHYGLPADARERRM